MEFFEGRILAFVMVLTRVSAFMISAPIFSWVAIPMRIRVAVAFLTSIFFAMITPAAESVNSIISVFLLLANEAVYGIALGLSTTLLYSAVKMSGRIAERQMGMAMAEVMDPFTGERAQPIGMMMEILFIMLLLSVDAHHLFLKTIARSFEVFAPGSIPEVAMLVKGIVSAGSMMLVMALKLAVPIMGVFMVMTVVLGVLARIAPEMNIFFLSFPIRIGLGLIMITYLVPFINSYTVQFAKLLSKLLPLS
ncbi:MAG: flagellar biosynthetic protein FliR [Planctomycetes bacterium]|nr:flagellar biosynthetic protein FliR [Planctomycetota bacterium]